MISNTDIRYFFDTYYDNFMHSLAWEDHLLEPASREEWLATLRTCADDQQQRCADNQILLEQYLYPLSSNPALLSDEGYDLLLSFCRDFYYSNYTEPALLIRIIDILLPHYEDRSDTESLLFLYICAGFSYMELSRTGEPTSRDKTIYFYTKVLSYRDQIEFFESAASRDYIFIAYYNLIRVAPGLGILDIETAYRLWEELCQIRTMPKFCQYDTTNPRIPQLCDRAINDFRAYGAVLNVERVIAPSAILSSLENMTQIYYSEILHEHGSIYECPVFTVFNYHYVQARNGTITWEAAWQILDDYYAHKMQTIGQVSSPDLLAFYTNLPLNLIDVLGHTHFKEEFKQATYRRYRNLITSYLINQPASLNSYTLNNGVQLVAFHPLILGTFQNRMEKMNFIVDLVVTRHLTTFTHSVMVSYLAEAIGKHILAARPELLRIPSSYLEGNVYASPAEVLDYIVPAALFHDIGKNGMIPIINTQHRKLNDYEFNIIQTHPQKGSDYLSSDPDFLIYQPVALGHHRSYDGTRGYPLSFDNTASPYRDAIDLIHICDCLDAATDYLSRNYHRAKPFDVVLNELKAGRGTEYNPDMVDVILSDRELYNDLKMLTEQNRENIYYDIYLTFVNLRKKRQ